jgi:hypothetical protein
MLPGTGSGRREPHAPLQLVPRGHTRRAIVGSSPLRGRANRPPQRLRLGDRPLPGEPLEQADRLGIESVPGTYGCGGHTQSMAILAPRGSMRHGRDAPRAVTSRCQTVAVSSHIDNVRPRTCRSGWGPTGDGRAGLLAFLIHEVGDGSGEALALAQHAAQDQQTANTASDGDNEEQPKDGVVAHSAILLTRTSLATGELRIHPPSCILTSLGIS